MSLNGQIDLVHLLAGIDLVGFEYSFFLLCVLFLLDIVGIVHIMMHIKYIFNSEGIILGVMVGLFSSSISSSIINVIRNVIKDKFNISISLNPNKYYIIGILISVLVTLLSSYFPSKKASKFDPVKSLKYE